jgi:protein-S-isoprenylcysteine O-methyltransferase Ste14
LVAKACEIDGSALPGSAKGSSALLYLLGTPLALGSYWGLVPLAGMLPFLIWRLLARGLPGYTQYQKKVRYRLLPGNW